MIAYVTVGVDDPARAKRFYGAFLPALGYGLSEGPQGLSYALPVEPGQPVVLPDFYVKPAFDGRTAPAGNGAMVAFVAHSQAPRCATFTPPRWLLAALTRARRVSGCPMGRISMWAICATLRATRSPCSQAIRTRPGGTAGTGFLRDAGAGVARQGFAAPVTDATVSERT